MAVGEVTLGGEGCAAGVGCREFCWGILGLVFVSGGGGGGAVSAFAAADFSGEGAGGTWGRVGLLIRRFDTALERLRRAWSGGFELLHTDQGFDAVRR